MKLVIAVVQRQDAPELTAALVRHGYRVTTIASEGGFLREGNSTLMLGADDDTVNSIIAIVREHCVTRTRYVSPLPPVAEAGEFYPPAPIEVQVGGATIFVLKANMIATL